MNTVRLVMSDIDGTILPPGQACVSERTVAAFHAAQDAGLVVGPASGRGQAQLSSFFDGDESCCSTCIASNGLEVYVAGERVCVRPPERAALERLREMLGDIPGSGLLAFDGAQPYLCCGAMSDLAVVVPRYASICQVIDSLPDAEIIKADVFVHADRAATDDLCARLNEEVAELDFDVPMTGFMNIMPAGWNKGAALQFLCDHLGIAPDEAVVFGDADNDLTMFKVAGHPVAVAGATAAARDAARWHIGRCEDDAVAAALEELASGKWPFTA